MSLFATSLELFAALLGASIALLLIVKWTAVLAMAWLARGMLVGRNPRWRVALWRSAAVGVVLVGIQAFVPPIVTYRFVPAGQDAVGVEHPVAPAPDGVGPAAPVAVPARGPVEAIDYSPPSARAIRTGAGPGWSAMSDVTRPVPVPAATHAQGIRWQDRLVWWLWSIWLAGVVVLMARLIVAYLELARIIRRSSDAPDEIVAECRMIAERLGCRGPVRVRRTRDIAVPCLTGLWRPVVLLPDQECDAVRPDDLRAILAHEVAHVRGHDLIWNAVLHLTSIVLWFHPFAWRSRFAHAAACDAVCDAVAADLLGDVASYSRTLARFALHSAGSAPCHGLAMARTSDVRRRIESLHRTLYRLPLLWRHFVPAMLVAGALLLIVGGLGITRAQQAPTTEPRAESVKAAKQTETKKPAGKLLLQAVSAETNEPMEGVSLQYQGRFGDKSRRATIKTGEDGTATIEWAAGAAVRRLWIDARKPGFAPIHIVWTDERHPLELPAAKELRFEQGTTIGGIVRNEAGHPIEGASVEINSPPTEYEGANYVFRVASLKTDAQGRWQLDDAPKNLAGTWTAVTHPSYRRGGGAVSRGLNNVTIFKKGLTITGRVNDAQGRPVKGARAVIGHDIWGDEPPSARTDQRGEFTLVNCGAGPSIITVQADGLAPRFVDVRVEEGAAPVIIALTEPGVLVRGRVVDADGKPVEGAFVAADTWRDHRSIRFRVNTDREGRFQWQGAPRDVVLYDFGKEGYMSSRHVALAASEREQTVVLHTKLVITGRVTEAGTHRPVPAFRVVQGRRFEGGDQVYWAENAGVDGAGGQYATQFDQPSAALLVRVEAPGYKPAESRAFRPNEGRQTFDFSLQRADGPSGIVLLPDGKPVPGAEVMLATRGKRVSLRSGRFDRNSNAVKCTTGPDGRFAFAPPGDRFLLIALNDAGYADASSDEFAKSGKLVLQPWGRIDGGVRIGPRYGSNREVSFQPIRPDRGGGIYVFDYGYTAQTDDRGRFVFDRVIPGPGTVTRNIVVEFWQITAHVPCWQESLEVKPGQTTQVKIGGKGRPVTGRVVLDGVPEALVDWTRNSPATIMTPRKERSTLAGGFSRFAANFNKDGRFRVEDVPAGKWELTVDVNAVPDPQSCGAGTEIGKAMMTIDVPEMPGGRSNEPLDVGTIAAKQLPVGSSTVCQRRPRTPAAADRRRGDRDQSNDRGRLGDDENRNTPPQ